MESVLDVYRRPYDARFPVVCMDGSPRQLIDEMKTAIAGAPGRPARYDYEYKRRGVCNVFMANEPLAGKRVVNVTERKTKRDWAFFIAEIAERYRAAEKITEVQEDTSMKSIFFGFVANLNFNVSVGKRKGSRCFSSVWLGRFWVDFVAK